MKAWHFLAVDKRLQYGDRQLVTVGDTLTATEKPLRLCEYGLHGSEHVFEALTYAPGPILCRVELGGEILREDDKVCAEQRTVINMRDVATQRKLCGSSGRSSRTCRKICTGLRSGAPAARWPASKTQIRAAWKR